MAASRMLVDPGLPLHRNQRVLAVATLLLVLISLPLAAEAAPQPTQTSLVLSAHQSTAGQPVILTATVTSNGQVSLQGTVSFLNGTHVLGIVQLTENQGPNTATLKMGFPPAVYSLTARFNANNLFQASQSAPQPLTVSGTEPTITTVQAAPDGGNYDFTVSVFGYGFPAPTGMASFTEVSTGLNLGSIGLPGPGMSTFLQQGTLQVGASPRGGIASGDFNGDGCPDLAVGDQNANTVSILLGVFDAVQQKCTGTFQPQMTFPVDKVPDAIAVGDFNADGILDLAVACHDSNAIDVLFGNGNGTFQAQVPYPTDTANAVAVGDFNEDGLPDLASAGIGSGQAGVLRNNGDGTFEQLQTFPAGVQPTGIAVGDFNGDGFLDMAVSASGSNQVAVLLGNGDGTFQQPTQFYNVGNNPQGIVTGDFNGDGCLDLAVTNYNDRTVGVLLGTFAGGGCAGTFQAQVTYRAGTHPQGITVADFNGDGILDLAVTNDTDNTVEILQGKGDGSFQPQQVYSVGRNPIGLAVADFFGDGVPDLAVANVIDNSVSVLLGGTLTQGNLNNIPVYPPGAQQILIVYTPDTNFYSGSQGSVQVQGSLIPTTTTLAVTANGHPISPGGAATSSATIVLNATVTPGTFGNLLASGTVSFFDGDSLLATIPTTINSDGNGVASFSPSLGLGPHALSAVYSGDNNFGPSNSSVFQLTIVGTYSVSLTVSPMQATSSTVVTMTAAVSGPFEVTGGTVTFFDGKQALGTVQVEGMAAPSPGTATLKSKFGPSAHSLQAVFNGIGQVGGSKAQSPVQTLTVTGSEPSVSTLAAQPDGNNFDFTTTVFGFGFTTPSGQVKFSDLTNGFLNTSVALVGPGMSSFRPPQDFQAGAGAIAVASGDFNGDGFPDTAIANRDESTVSVLLGNGDGTFQQQKTFPTDLFPAGIAVGDFNGDGIPDLAVAGFGSSFIDVLLGNGDGSFQAKVEYPTDPPIAVAVGDFNNDGLPDLATASQTGTAGVLLNNGDGTFAQQKAFPAGNVPAAITVGDFNRDGNLDLAVADRIGNTVTVLLGNGDGKFQQPSKQFWVGNAPFGIATADLNGDGILDLAVTNLGGDQTVSVLLGTGDGSFQPQQTYPVGTAYQVAIADLNGDGIPDLAVTNWQQHTVSVLLGKGDGTFQPQQIYEAGQVPTGIALTDFNGDGVPDVATTNFSAKRVSILLGGTVTSGQLNNVPIIGSGDHMIQSSYLPDASSIYTASLSNPVTVPAGGKAPTSVTLTETPAEGNFGNNMFFTAVVQSPGGGTPTGTVSFMEGSTLLGTASLVANANGQGSVANYTNNTLVQGQHSITATYTGDSNYNASNSQPVTVMVDIPFVLQTTKTMDTVPPGGNTQFQSNVIAAYQHNVYANMTCTAPPGVGITCSITCPPSNLGLPGSCVLSSLTDIANVTITTSSGTARLVPPLHRGRQRVVAFLMSLGGIGLVGLVFVPGRLRRRAAGGILLLVIVVLCFGTSCGSSFAPGISSPPVNNTFYISVNAELREQLGNDPAQFRTLGLQKFWFTLLIK
jgi:Bacterial Ig-like domain (group 3)/FG-GAP-like repeat